MKKILAVIAALVLLLPVLFPLRSLADNGGGSPLKITGQPQNAAGKVGETVTFNVEASGDGLTWRWQIKGPGAYDWVDTSRPGNRSDTLIVKVTESVVSGTQFRCVIGDKYGQAKISGAATLTVTGSGGISSALRITGQPKDVTGKVGDTVTFTVEASGEGLTWRWQTKSPAATDWTDSSMTGSRSKKLSVNVMKYTVSGTQYRCVVKDRYGNVETTGAAALTVSGSENGQNNADYGSGTLEYIDITQSGVMAKIGDRVDIGVKIVGGDKAYRIEYILYCDCAYQKADFDIAKVSSGQARSSIERFDHTDRNAMCMMWRFVPTENTRFSFAPLHKGHYFLSAYVTDSKGLEYWADTSMILVYDDADMANRKSEYNAALGAIRTAVKEGMTERQTARAIHDWIIKNTEYGDLPGYESVLVSHKGVCNDYAKAYEFLCTLAGLKCRFFRGGPMDHAWNIVRIDGKWLHVDCTWDDEGDRVSNQYLFLNSYQMAADHQWTTYPDCMLSPYPYDKH